MTPAQQPGRRRNAVVGWTLALACMTRYEAWPVTICALVAAVYAWWRSGVGFPASCRRAASIAVYPAMAVAAFAIYSRVVIGEWFTTSGFFVPENKALGRPLVAAAEIWWGAHALSGSLTIAIAAIGLAALLVIASVYRRRAASLIPLALLASAALPWAAFVRGHPFRIRYMVPLIAIEAIGAGAAVGVVKRAALASALVVATALAFDIRPLDPSAPMVLEAQWDVPNVPAREAVTRCLRADYDGETIMASMGSLGHYMQEAATSGFAVRNFLHEGNGDIWLAALDGPRPYAGWLHDRGKSRGRRHAGQDCAGEPVVSRRVRSRLRWRRPRAVPPNGGTATCCERLGACLSDPNTLLVRQLPRRTTRTCFNRHHPGLGRCLLAVGEADVDREQVIEPAQIDLAPRESLSCRQVSLRVLILDLEAES